MAVILTNTKINRTFTYSGILQFDVGVNQYTQKFVQDLLVEFNDDDLERDRIDDGSPVFTRIGDVLGKFTFALKNTVDLAEAATPATDDWTMSKWIEDLVANTPTEVKFISTYQAPDSTGNKFERIRFTGRIMRPAIERLRERAVDEALVEGEIIAFVSLLREAT